MDARGLSPIPASDATAPARGVAPAVPAAGRNQFKRLLQETQSAGATAAGGVTISAHAQDRLRMRNIALTNSDIAKIGATMDRVAQKGGRQSLFMMKTAGGQETAMVVSVRNRVVITAVDGNSLKENIFTNIDSAAIVQ